MASPQSSSTVLYTDGTNFASLIQMYIWSASGILLLMSINHIRLAISKRLWLFPSDPSKGFALNAETLALLSIAAKPPNDNTDSTPEISKLLGTVLICVLMGTCMPSIATADLSDMWNNVAGVGLLAITAIVNIYLQLTAYVIIDLRFEHKMVIIFMGMLLLVLCTQALALGAIMFDMRAMVSEQLEEIRTEVRPGLKVDVVQEKPWNWDVLEQESYIKLMMVLTSNPQNVVARSPSTAVIGALVLSSLVMLLQAVVRGNLIVENGISVYDVWWIPTVTAGLQVPTIFFCGSICVWRCLRVTFHEDRPPISLILDAEPSYWRRKVNKFWNDLRDGPHQQPNILEGQYRLKEALHRTTAFLFSLTVVPMHWMIVAFIRFSHILSALLMQVLIWSIKALAEICLKILWFPRRGSGELAATVSECLSVEPTGVMCLAGEDARIIRREFEKAARIVIHRQIKRAHTKTDIQALVTFLGQPRRLKDNGILLALDHRGAPDIDKLHVEHGYQFGWCLTAVSLLEVLTEIEKKTLARSEASKAAMDAYWQATEMLKVMDEQYLPIVCSKETYLAASASVWSTLLKKHRRWSQEGNRVSLDMKDPVNILKALLRPAESHVREFNEKSRNCKWWTDLETCAETEGGGASVPKSELVKHISFLLADIMAGCLSNLPIALNSRMTNAVRAGQTDIVENGIFIIAQGKKLWEKLKWPTPCGPENTLGQIGQWFQ